MKKEIIGYSKKEVEAKLREYEEVIDTQKRDIIFLKNDNKTLRNTLEEINSEVDN